MLASSVIHSDKTIWNRKQAPEVRKKKAPISYRLLGKFRMIAAFPIDCQYITFKKSHNSSAPLLPIIKIGITKLPFFITFICLLFLIYKCLHILTALGNVPGQCLISVPL